MLSEIAAYLTAQNVGILGLVLFVLSWFVEVSKIKLNPWTALAKVIGKAVNGEVIEKVDDLKINVTDLQQHVSNNDRRVQALQETNDERYAKECRIRIIRFGDELLHDVRHSKDHFDQVLIDIKDYTAYCAEHPEFENGITGPTTKYIREVYAKRLDEHDFL